MGSVRGQLCSTCAELFEGQKCPTCKGFPAKTRAEIEAWERARLAKRLDEWRRDGVIDAATAKRVRAAAGLEPAPEGDAARVEEERPPAKASLDLEAGVDRFATGFTSFFGEVSSRYAKMAADVAKDAPPPSKGARPLRGEVDHESHTAYATGGDTVVSPGVEALEELDEAHGGPGKPLGALQVFWFIGTVLVLAGSLMGVREAWRSLDGVLRPLVIAGALFGYHAAFVALARVLAKRSAVTGRVLGVIAAGLLPVVFVAGAVAIGMSRGAGTVAAAAILVASAGTLVALGRVFGPRAGVGLVIGLVPALALEIVLGFEATTTNARLSAPLVAIAVVLWSALRARRASDARVIASLSASLYGAVAVAAYTVFGGPQDTTLDMSSFGPPELAAVLWVAALGAVSWFGVHEPASAGSLSNRLRGASSVVAVVSLALVVGAALAGTIAAVRSRDELLASGVWAWAPAAAAALGAAALAVEARHRSLALHVAVPLAHVAAFLVARVATDAVAAQWAAPAVVPAALFVLGPVLLPRRPSVLAWSFVSSLAVTAITLGTELSLRPPVPATDACTTTMTVALALAAAAHLGGRAVRPSQHYVGGLLLVVALSCWLVPTRDDPWTASLGYALVAAGVIHAVMALGYAAIAPKDSELRPFDDVSLVAGIAAAWLAVFTLYPQRLLALGLSDLGASLAASMPALLAAGLLALRAPRDASRLVTAHAGLGLAVIARVVWGPQTPLVFVGGTSALALSAIGALRGEPEPEPPRFGRALFGLVPLPLGGRGWALLDGFAVSGAVIAALTTALTLPWIGAVAGGWFPPTLSERDPTILGMVAVVVTMLVLFGTRALQAFGARGHVGTLALGGLAIAVTAIVNRIGRPLAPEIVGRNLSVVAFGVWLVARLFVRVGPKVASALDKPTHGRLYHFIPHAGVAALAALLAIDAFLVGGPSLSRALVVVPPLMVFGAALGCALLYRSSHRPPLLHAALALLFAFASLASAQRAVLGPHLTPLSPPGSRWVPTAMADAAANDWTNAALYLVAPDGLVPLWDRAAFGGGVFVVACALLGMIATRAPAATRALRSVLDAPDDDAVPRALTIASAVGAFVVAVDLTAQPSLVTAVLLILAGALGLLSRGPPLGALPIALGLPLLVHAFVGPLVPAWSGPALAAEALAVVVGGRYLALRDGRDQTTLLASQVFAAALGAFALLYAVTALAPTDPAGALASIFAASNDAAGGAWAQTSSPGITLALLGVASAAAAWSWRGTIAGALSVLPPLLLGLAGAALGASLSYTSAADVSRLTTRDGPAVAAGVAIAVLAAHAAVVMLARAERTFASAGTAIGRDVVVVAAGAVMVAFLAAPEPGGLYVGVCGVVALGVPLVVSFDAVVRQKTARHVYVVELFVVGLYTFATRDLGVRPELHALLGLAYGFTLLGVAVVARRRGAERVAGATRRFLAVLPLVLAFVTMQGTNDAAAIFALGAAMLYGATAFAEKSRVFSSLAALAANVALVVFALARGLDGVEIWVGPLGLLVAALGQIFASKMSPAARSAVRVIGGGLLYMPAGLKLALRLGAAEDGTYSVVFGAVCLLGVVAGLVLRVRAYLALATMALTLDVIANLVYAGLRDHRVGFVLLSATGLFILGIMILVTLRRDRALALAARLRAKMRGWE
ncbi:MAG: hypothetical protein KC657_16630 [Myxococcales bacterium]|nr:hypothetical protein [Myxococcales bacterium]